MQRHRQSILLLIGLTLCGLSGCAKMKLFGEPEVFGTAAAMPGSTSKASLPFGLSDPAGDDAKDPNEGPFALARLCERRGEDQQAEHLYNVLLEKTPNDAKLHHRLGVLAVKKGNFAEAEQRFRTAQSMGPATAELLSDMGYCQYLQCRFPEAESLFVEALKLDPNHAASLNNLALVVGRQGRIDESLRLFQRTNKEGEAYANLAYVLAQNGNFDEAEKAYLHALTLDNNMRTAAHAVMQINDRKQAQARLENLGPMASVSGTNGGPAMSDQVVRLPKTDL